MEAVQRNIQQFGVRRAALILGGGLAVMLLVSLLFLRGSEPEMGYLYTDLDPGSAATISEKLRGQNVPFQVSPDGAAVMAPADRLAELRMSFAADQLGGKIGYEVIDGEQPFGTSSSRAKLNERRAMEGELARSIETMQSVRKARVHVVMPEHELFSNDDRPASAAITLVTLGHLNRTQTDAIRYLVAAAVPALSPERISIVDQSGTLLARLGDEAGLGSIAERQDAIETRLRENVQQLLEGVVGPGKARAEVVAELNLSQVREESETYDPDKQVVARQTALDSNNEAAERANSGDASVGAQLPGADASKDSETRRTTGAERSEETVYQNSMVKKTAVSEGGDIKRLTVSVMVDKTALRSPAESERLTRLVENAVGYNEERGDRVVVEAMPFAKDATPADEEEDGSLMTGDQMVSLGTNVVLGLLALAAVFVVARAIRAAPKALPEPAPAVQMQSLPSVSPEMHELAARAAAGDEDAMRQIAALENRSGNPPLLDHEIDLAFVHGRMKASTMARVGEVVKENRSEAVSVVRQWMQE